MGTPRLRSCGPGRPSPNQMGGDEKVERQHHYGKLTIRERLDAVVDEGSFHEFGKTAGVASYDDAGKLIELRPSNFVFGTARIDGRPVIVSGDDFTVRGGSADASIIGKRLMSEGIGRRTPLTTRSSDRWHGRGRVCQDDRDGGAYLHSGDPRLGHNREAPRRSSVGILGPRLRGRHRRRAGGHLPLFGDRGATQRR